MDKLDAFLMEATRRIDQKYFDLPIHGAPAKFIERVYCYEFYHQLRLQMADEPEYTLNGEVDKGNHPFFLGIDLDAIPDFLIHVPGGGNDKNYAIIEVKKPFEKPKNAASKRWIKTDVRKLIRFQREAQYQRGIYLIYGQEGEYEPDVLDAIYESRQTIDANCPVEVWFHRAAGEPAFRVV